MATEYESWVDRLVDMRLSAHEATVLEDLVARGVDVNVALDRILQTREDDGA